MARVRRYHPLVADDCQLQQAITMKSQRTLEIGSERLFANAYVMWQTGQHPLDAFKTKCGPRLLISFCMP